MARGSIHLIAYPDWRRTDVQSWHDAIFKDAGKSNPQVALFTAAGEEDPEEIRWFTMAFRRRYNADVHPIRLLKKKTSPNDSKRIIRHSDVLYFTGGDHFVLVRAVLAAGLDDDLRQRHEAGAVVGAYSAGAIAIGAWWPEWPDPERPDLPEEGAQLVRCLGLNTRVICDFHAEEDEWEELYACLRLLYQRDPSKKSAGYGVPTRGAIRISESGEVEFLGDRGPWLETGAGGVTLIR